MRIAVGITATAVVLFLTGAIGVVGSWAVAAGAALLLVGGVVAAIAMEERDPGFAPIPTPLRTTR